MFTPRLWFDATVSESYPDCSCACSGTTDHELNQVWITTLARQVSTNEVQRIFLNQNNIFHRIDGHLIALNTEGERVVVLDQETSHLLNYFPAHLEELRTRFSLWSREVFDHTIALLLGLKILSSPQTEDLHTVQERSNALEAWFHLTNQCTLSCLYCYVLRNDQKMKITTAQYAVEAVYRSALKHSFSMVRLKYSGGEPTLNFEGLLAAQQCAETLSKQTGIELEPVLLTNGVQITDTQIEALLKHNIKVIFSLDGIGQYQDAQRPLAEKQGSSFERIVKTLDRLIACGISPYISITITRQSLPGLLEIVDYLLSRRLHFNFNFYREPKIVSEDDPLAFTSKEMIEGIRLALQVIEKRLPEHSLLVDVTDRADLRLPHVRTCGVGQNYLVIDCNGNISKCQMEMDRPITTIAAADPLGCVQADHEGIQNLPVDQKECKECVWRYRCTGGCPRLTFQRTGRYDAKSPLCEVYQAILPEVVRLEALRLLKYEEPWDFSFLPN